MHGSQTALQTLAGHAVGDGGGGRALALGALEDLRQGRADAFDMRLELGGAAAGALVADIDDAAGVDRVIRRIQAFAATQGLGQAGIGQLVVGGAGDDRRAQRFEGLWVDDGAEGAGGEDVDVEAVDIVLADRRGAELGDRALHVGGLDIGHP